MTNTDIWPATITARPLMRPEFPLLWRTATSIQIGDHVIVDDVTGEAVSWLAALDGSQTCSDVSAAAKIGVDEQRVLIHAAFHAGALTDSRLAPECWRWVGVDDRIRVQQDWNAAATAYPPESLTEIAEISPETVIDARWRTKVAVTGADALSDAVREAVRSHGIGISDSPDDADVVILCSPGHAQVVPAVSPDRPHLHVGTHGSVSIVGPMVVPGHTSCLRCAHLHHRDADPSWPLVAVQLQQRAESARSPVRDNLLVRLSATYAVILVRAWIDQPIMVSRWGNIALETSLTSASAALAPLTVARPTHPSCGCTWDR